MSRHKTANRRRPTEQFSGRSYADYRRTFNQILTSAGEGRITLEVLKGISRTLLQFFGCCVVEIVFQEDRKVLHAKTVSGKPPATSGWKEKSVLQPVIFFDAIESVPPDLVDRLKSRYQADKKKAGGQKIVFMFPDDGQPKTNGLGHESARHVFLLIPAGRSVAGVLALSFTCARTADYISRDFLNRLASIVGLSLSHNLSRFELRERVKELTCMYNIANLAVSSDQLDDPFLQQVGIKAYAFRIYLMKHNDEVWGICVYCKSFTEGFAALNTKRKVWLCEEYGILFTEDRIRYCEKLDRYMLIYNNWSARKLQISQSNP